MKKIAYCIRKGYESGGDGVQVIKTKAYIESAYDVTIDIITDPETLSKDYDLVHIFNYVTYESTRLFFKRAIELGLKIVSSPIYWDYSYSIQPVEINITHKYRFNFLTESYAKMSRAINLFLGKIPMHKCQYTYYHLSNTFKKDLMNYIDHSQLILPNSIAEGELCCTFANRKKAVNKIREIYNGVDIKGVSILPEKVFFEKYKLPHNYVLQVGRVEFTKNQLNLISALMDRPEIPIVILGNMKVDLPYVEKLKELAHKRGNIFFITNVPHEEVYSFYHYAATHVLLSLRESPGLVSLEALSQGCPIVVSDKRFLPVSTYFTEQYESVNPFDKSAIKNAVLKSINKTRYQVDLSGFSWEIVAKQTFMAYCEILK